ncbi:MAG TPA: DUF222 domain-containing protein [Kribbellaceae bacterium]|nr:DUF222 domain-containing protein [Kribbellaceae bacterium]
MFDGEVMELDAAGAIATAAELRATADRAEAKLLEVAAHFADLNPEPHPEDLSGDVLPGMEQTRVYGGEGCPEVAEFAPVEFGAALGMSSGAAAQLIGDALALRHRFPKTWARVHAGEVPSWRARKIASGCLTASRAVATLVDTTVAPIAEKVTPYRLERILVAATLHADPAAARAAVDRAADDRGVWTSPTDVFGTKDIHIRAAAGDATRFDASIGLIADCLGSLGDTSSENQRRAKAVGWIANPQASLNLWDHIQQLEDLTAENDHHSATTDQPPITTAEAKTAGTAIAARPTTESVAETLLRLRDTDGWFVLPRGERGRRGANDNGDRAGTGSRPGHRCGTSGAGGPTVYVHLTQDALATGAGVVRVEGAGTGSRDGLSPIWVSQLAELVGHTKFTVKPVIDLADRISVHAYEIPDRIRERVQLKYPTCMFPWCHRPAIGCDLDHVVPYDDTGPPGQTATDKLLPGCRLHHRVKTLGRWRCRRLDDGAVEWTSPHGLRYRVDHTGTHRLP